MSGPDDDHRSLSQADSSDAMHAECPGRDLFETITNRWTLLILWALKDGRQRFFVVRDRVEGISERVLSENLKTLCRSGLIDRHVEPSVPPKVSYSLTPIGIELLEVMERLTGWIAANLPEIEAAALRYDAASESGSSFGGIRRREG